MPDEGREESKQPPHRWLIRWQKKALDAIQELSSDDRMAVFDSLKRLAEAENPYAVPGVKKLKGSNILRRVRAGDYRITFTLESGEIVHLRFTYKGRIVVYDIFIHHTGY